LIIVSEECADINGNNRRIVVELEEDSAPYGLALTETKIFWTDWKR